ncbi:4-alpha-glucanotransferase [Nocardiopsis halotolerans]|uniref:4-alpha-glucanotransferase n=1 Tax=Nocardiopsis halotolerans TaxID=124252 RepID=UPI000380BE69|nr:4-alpha-glucanotransferase [Nocardiopsis halotolerans]
MAPTDPLRELAREHGVATSYTTDRGARQQVHPDTLVAVLAACGVDGSTPRAARGALEARRARLRQRLLPACTVVRISEESSDTEPYLWLPEGSSGEIVLEDGGRRELAPSGSEHRAGRLRYGVGPLPHGRHGLRVQGPDSASSGHLLAVPDRVRVPDRRTWGLTVQLYSLLSRRSWGMGDLSDLTTLARWSGSDLGADFVQLGPLHATDPSLLADPSPYRPSSRRFADPMHVRVEDVPEYRSLSAAEREEVDALATRARADNAAVLDGSALIDRGTVRDRKLRALRLLHRARARTPARGEAFGEFSRAEGGALEDFATWCALAEVHGGAWRSWPAELRDPRSPSVSRAREALRERVDFHMWAVWVTDEQLAGAQRGALDAGMRVGLVHDLAVGVAPEGADTWMEQASIASGVSVGAPPDDFNRHGQDWGQPPWLPEALAEAAYEPFAGLLRSALRHSGALRVDHVMGLFRLWWIPQGCRPSEGTYVRYDHEGMLGALALEAHRADAGVIGEDLGTVEPWVGEELDRRGFLGTSVQRFEFADHAKRDRRPLSPERWRRRCLATLTTHDLPTTAAWLSGEHVRIRAELGLLTRPEEREAADAAAERDAWLLELSRLGLITEPLHVGDEEAVLALHRFLRLTPALMLGVWLPDAVGDRRPQNLPGTATVHPNWRLPVADPRGRPVPLDELPSVPLLRRIAEVFADLDPHSVGKERDADSLLRAE